MPFTAPPPRALIGALLMACAMACFAMMDATTKVLAVSAPIVLVMWVRYVFQVAVLSAFWLPGNGWRLPRTARPRLQTVRGLLVLSTGVVGFIGIQAIPLAEFTAIVLLTPIMLMVLAVFDSSQTVTARHWICVGAGMAGALIVLRPGAIGGGTRIVLIALAIVAVNTGHQWLTSRIARLEDPRVTQWFSGVVGAVVCTLGLPFVWHAFAGAHWGLLLLVCVLGLSGHQMLIRAYGFAPMSTLAPYLYLQLAFATLAAWAFFGQAPDGWSMLGIGLIGAGGVWSTRVTRGKVMAAPPEDLGAAEVPTR